MFSERHYDNLQKAHYYLETISYTVHYVANLPAVAGNWIDKQFSSRQQLLLENQELKENNLLLKSKLHQFSALEDETRRLKKLLGASHRKIHGNAIVAKLIATDYTPFKQRIILNRGKLHEVYIGQPILGARGIIGQVIQITPYSATGMLISDPIHSVLAQVTRSGLRALVSGTGDPKKLRLDYVSLDADIREGDILTTSRLDKRYPPDYPIGKVTRVKKNVGNNFADITVEPAAKIRRNLEVLLVARRENNPSSQTANDSAHEN